MTTPNNKPALQKEITRLALALYQRPVEELSTAALHECLSRAVMQRISRAWSRSRQRHATRRRAYYLSAEYLIGRAVHNNLLCTGMMDEAEVSLEALGHSLGELEHIEDAALGNGGLGRLAACYLDSAATLGLPLDGYGIRYRYGLFRQRFAEGFQQEDADDWARFGDPWSVRREDEAVTVPFRDRDVLAVPYDTPIIGYGGKHISTLRLWQCEPATPFDFTAFNEQRYDRSVREKNRAEDISRVLYPNDSTPAGRLLRLEQQYFFCSASLQDMLRSFSAVWGHDWAHLPEQITIQLNDTHPVIAIPELIRLLEERGVGFSQAVDIAKGVFNYTNHTVMPEAMERWDMHTVGRVSPAIARIIRRLATRQRGELRRHKVPEEQWPRLLLLQEGIVHMAYLACWCCGYVNGVAALHTAILQETVLREWHALYPNKIKNVTNGITQRRWLALANPPLAGLISKRLGNDRWMTRLEDLAALAPLAGEETLLRTFVAVKQTAKERLAEYMQQRDGLTLPPEHMLAVQVKRIHEYKRQLLNILSVLAIYFALREGELADFAPTVYLFGGKAAPGYFRAKAVIKLIHEVGRLIAADKAVCRRLQVIFVPGYDVSYAERIMAAADVSEQISTAGTEASGTGNMKLMLNGALTLGTYDGATVEMAAAVGEENMALCGHRVEELRQMQDGYDPREYYERDPRIRRCLESLVDGTLDDGGTGMFRELYNALLEGAHWHKPDHYFLLADFDEYLTQKLAVNREYAHDRLRFAAKQWRNVCAAGRFSSDRAVAEYAKEIWKISRVSQRG